MQSVEGYGEGNEKKKTLTSVLAGRHTRSIVEQIFDVRGRTREKMGAPEAEVEEEEEKEMKESRQAEAERRRSKTEHGVKADVEEEEEEDAEEAMEALRAAIPTL